MGKLTLLDGASGTLLWEIAEKNGVAKDPVWKYNIEHPDFVAAIAKRYIEAGSDIIFTNTFSANRSSVARSTYSVEQIVTEAVKIAKSCTEGTDVKTFLDVGPLSEMLEPYGDLEEDEAEEIYREIIEPGVTAGADGIVLETFMDLEMLKIAARVACESGLPVFCSMSFEKHGKTMFGNSVEQIVEELSEFPVTAIGMNCSLGPDAAVSIIKQFAENSKLPVFAKPNAGLPVMAEDGTMVSPYTAEMFFEEIQPVLDTVSYVGACCGSNPDYIKVLKSWRDN